MKAYVLGLLLMTVASPALAQEPTLENFEKLGEEIEEAAPKVDAVQPAPIETSPNVSRPASDASSLQAVDIKGMIKKVSEPNLFAGIPPNPGSVRTLASGEAPEEYEVQQGDNLYDICDQLIDEPKYWPKLWAFNPTINNPHFVYPGMKLRFYSGDGETPPFLQVVTDDDILPVAKGSIKESELVREDINGMLMRSEISDNMHVIDASDLGRIPGIEGMIIDVGGSFRAQGLPVIIPAFIVEDEFEVLGEVVAGSSGAYLVDKGQSVVVKDKNGLAVGTNYTVVRKTGRVKTEAAGETGIRYEFIAQVRMESQDKEDESIYKSQVIFNRLGIQPGDFLVPYRSVKRTIPLRISAEGKGLEQKVVGFTESHTVIGGRGDFIFLEQSEGKLKEQETYTIRQKLKVAAPRELREQLPNTSQSVAHVYILDSSGAAALGYLVSDAFEVRIGDTIAR